MGLEPTGPVEQRILSPRTRQHKVFQPEALRQRASRTVPYLCPAPHPRRISPTGFQADIGHAGGGNRPTRRRRPSGRARHGQLLHVGPSTGNPSALVEGAKILLRLHSKTVYVAPDRERNICSQRDSGQWLGDGPAVLGATCLPRRRPWPVVRASPGVKFGRWGPWDRWEPDPGSAVSQ